MQKLSDTFKILLLITFLFPSAAFADEEMSNNKQALPPSVVISSGELVDLGLSVSWCSHNVGANSPEDYGDYFAWGETCAKSEYDESTYLYYSNGKFIDIGHDINGTQYDAAHVIMGGSWRMPSDKELTELRYQCLWQWVKYRGVNGYKIIGPNGNSIFMPAAGGRDGKKLNALGIYGYYWSGTRRDNTVDDACSMLFSDGFVDWGGYFRLYGQSIRPVSQ